MLIRPPDRRKPDTTDKMSFNGIQTGYIRTDVTIVNQVAITADPSQVIGLTNVVQPYNIADLIHTAPTNYINRDEDGVSLSDWALLLAQQMFDFLRYVGTTNVWPVTPAPTATTAVLFEVYEWFRAGVLQDDAPAQTQDRTPATDLAECVDGIKGFDSGLGAHDYHVHKAISYMYTEGFALAEKLPDLNSDQRGQSNTVQLDRHIWVLMFKPLMAWVFGTHCGAINSEQAMNSIAAMIPGYIRRDFPEEIRKAKTNQHWPDVFGRGKDDPLGAVFTAGNHYAYDQEFLGRELLLGGTIDPSIRAINTPYRMVGDAIKYGQEHFGLGIYNKNAETVFFGVLMNKVESATYTTHGVNTWELGLNLDYFLRLMDAVHPLWAYWDRALKRKHWTWTDVLAEVKDVLVEFTISKSFHGVVSDDVFRPARATFRFSDLPDPTTGWMNEGVFPDVEDMVDVGGARWVLGEIECTWVLPYWYNTYPNCVDKDDGLMMPISWSDREIAFRNDYHMMAYQGSGVTVDHFRHTISRLQLVQAIQMRPPAGAAIVECNMYASVQEYRFENVADVLAAGVVENIRMKYFWELFYHTPDMNWLQSIQRPKGLAGSEEEYFEKVGGHKINGVWGVALIGRPQSLVKASVANPPPNVADKNPPVSTTQVDADDETTESE